MDSEWITVIGVVKDVIYNRDGIVIPVFYRPARQRYTPGREVIVRTGADPRSLIASARHALQSIDPTLPRFEIATVDDRLSEQDRPWRFQAELITIFAGLAVILAASGLYGLMAYSVEQRTKEIGIRMALGSTRAGVARLVLKQALAWGGIGIAIGIAGAVLFGRALSASLYGLAPGDPVTFIGVIAVLVMVAFAASAMPVFRASRVDPIVALRHD